MGFTVLRSPDSKMSRAQACLLGQLAGDALGSLVEFRSPGEIRHDYPGGVRDLVDGGTWNTIAGQPTDDSEMALLLARMLVKRRVYDPRAALEAYKFWLISGPFDCGMTIASALRGRPNPDSQANGAMMRVSPLGIFGANHPHPVCLQANALFTMAIAHAVRTGSEPRPLYENLVGWAADMNVEGSLTDAILGAADSAPRNYAHQQGWVLIAFRNALWQLLHARNFDEGVVDTVMRGGDTDTNAAICGALLGAVYGLDAIPSRWVDRVLNCHPAAGQPGVYRPRPECFWPVDALDLAQGLLT
jgi:ADP-ribosyl-[dinitrogen reductase] hydrolase